MKESESKGQNLSSGEEGEKTGRRRSLRTIMLLVFTVQVFAAVGITGYLSYRQGAKAVYELAGRLCTEIALRVEQHLDSYLNKAALVNDVNLRFMRDGLLKADSPQSLLRFYWDQGQAFRGLGTIAFANDRGEFYGANEPEHYLVLAHRELTGGAIRRYAPDTGGGLTDTILRERPGYDARTRDWYQAAVKAGGPTWTDISVSVTGARLDLSAVAPFFDDCGILQGVFLTDVSLGQFSHFLHDLNIGEGGEVFVMDKEGLLVASSFEELPYVVIDRESNDVRRLRATESQSPLIADAATFLGERANGNSGAEPGWFSLVEVDGKGHFLKVVPYKRDGLDFLVVAVIPEEHVMVHIHEGNRNTFFLIVGALLVAIGFGLWTSNWVADPIVQLRSWAAAIGRGTWETPPSRAMERRDEVGDLARSFKYMAFELQGAIESLEAQIAERQRAEDSVREALRRTEDEKEKTKAILAGVGDGISIQDREFRVIYQNQVHKDLVGSHEGELCYVGYENGDGVCEGCPVELTFQDGRIHTVVRKVPREDGVHYYEITTSPLKNAEGEIVGGIEAVRDISDRRKAQDSLEQERERLAVTLRSIGDGVIVTDIVGTVTLINRVGEQITGWSAREAIGKPLADVFRLVDEKTREPLGSPTDRAIRSGTIVGIDNAVLLLRKDGGETVIEDSAAPIQDRNSVIIGVVLVFRDATQKRRMEEELLKTQKLESVGVLAGGLAHDFNNFLTMIVGNISLARMDISDDSEPALRLAEAEKAARRASDLTSQLLTFAKGGAPVKKTASITEIVQESVNFAVSGSKVRVEYEIAAEVWNAEVDTGQMSQVFSNLVINGIQAMPHGGVLAVRVKNEVVSENEIPTLGPGNYVKVSIQDGGVGIPRNLLTRIFDPYFTTKQKGSGLGLSSAYTIVQNHQGHIAVQSTPGQGTVFHVYIPASSGRVVSGGSELAELRGGHGKILVMDDEKTVRAVAGAMLGKLGYEVAFAADGQEALRVYREAAEAGEPFRAVIMDLTIPGAMGGKEAVDELLRIDPSARAIVSSGYSNDPVMGNFEAYGFRGVITKPYSIDGFSKALRAALSD